MRSREAAFAALFAKISAAYAWKNTPSRRLVLWTEAPKDQRPSFFQFEGGKTTYAWTNGVIPKRVIEAKLFIYLDSTDHSVATSPLMNTLMDVIDGAFALTGQDMVTGKQTLGGTCEFARIDGDVITDPGDIDDDGLIVVPVKITLP